MLLTKKTVKCWDLKVPWALAVADERPGDHAQHLLVPSCGLAEEARGTNSVLRFKYTLKKLTGCAAPRGTLLLCSCVFYVPNRFLLYLITFIVFFAL